MHASHFIFSNLRVRDAKCNNISWHFHKNTQWRGKRFQGGKEKKHLKTLNQILWLLPCSSNASDISQCETKLTSSAHPEQPPLFPPCNGFSSFLTTYVQDKHLRLRRSINFSVLVAVQHIIWSYGMGFVKDGTSRSQESATWSLLSSSSKRFTLSGQAMKRNFIVFIPLKVDAGFVF